MYSPPPAPYLRKAHPNECNIKHCKCVVRGKNKYFKTLSDAKIHMGAVAFLKYDAFLSHVDSYHNKSLTYYYTGAKGILSITILPDYFYERILRKIKNIIKNSALL